MAGGGGTVLGHGVPGVDRGGNIPNPGYQPARVIANLDKYVVNGPLTDLGMPVGAP